jgi:hypothetical protein
MHIPYCFVCDGFFGTNESKARCGGIVQDESCASGALMVVVHGCGRLWLQIDNNVKREITNHRLLRHKNIVQFIKVGVAVLVFCAAAWCYLARIASWFCALIDPPMSRP